MGGWLAGAAALERAGRALGDAAAATAAALQPTAEALGAALKLVPEDTALFSEEVRACSNKRRQSRNPVILVHHHRRLMVDRRTSGR